MLGWESWWQAVVAFLAALGGGAMNALAGGGTLLAFPVLLWLGLPPVEANATNAVALWPGSFGGAWGFRHDLAHTRRWWLWLAVPSLVGGAIGAFLLVSLPSTVFAGIAPYLVLASSALIATEAPIKKALRFEAGQERTTGHRIMAMAVELVIGIYGGYFGAGLGILILTALGLQGVDNLHQANGLKNLFSIAIKGVAVVYFIFAQAIAWHAVILMVIGAVIGGYASAEIGSRISETVMRWIVVLIGVGMAVAMLVRLELGA